MIKLIARIMWCRLHVLRRAYKKARSLKDKHEAHDRFMALCAEINEFLDENGVAK